MSDWRRRFAEALGNVQTEPFRSYDEAVQSVVLSCKAVRLSGNRVFFIGNGGSAGIASHMAADWLKNGHFKAMCFNDGALMSCIENDIGHNASFAVPLEHFAQPDDLVFAISSSGKSPNILVAAEIGRSIGATVVTLSGFDADNPLRKSRKDSDGGVSFYVPSHEYGFVECVHQCILHEILDTVMEDDVK